MSAYSRAAVPGSIDVAVVGAGIIGMLAALMLDRHGARIALLDSGIPSGTDANAGSLHVQLQSRLLRLFPELIPRIETSLPLYLLAIQAWKTISRELGGVELVQDGGLMVAESPEEMAFLRQKAEREQRHGLDIEILDRTALERMAPWLGPRIIGAELCRDEGKVNPLLANSLIRKRLGEAGIQVQNATVIGLAESGRELILASGNRLAADQILIAAGWGTEALARSAGVRIIARCEAIHMNITEPACYRIRQLVQHAAGPITFKQFSAGQIVIGGGWPAFWDPGAGVPRVLEDSLLGNVALAGRILPAIRPLRILRSWAGLHTVTDGGTILGALPGIERVTIAVPGDSGYTLGPLLASAAADLLLGRDPDFDIIPHSPDRFLN